MANWQRWVKPGLAATFLLALIAVALHAGTMATRIAERVEARLAADGQDWARIEVSGRSVTIEGTAPSVEAQKAARDSARVAGGVMVVSDASDLLPIADPYVWTVRKAGDVVTFLGFVPSESFRTSLLASARRAMPEARIHDDTQLARGAPRGLRASTDFVLDRLSVLSDATISISDQTLSVSGVAATSADFASARARFGTNLPAGLSPGPIDILPARAEPFVWVAEQVGQAVRLSGYAPDEIVGESILATAEQAMPGAQIENGLAIASGAPDGFVDVTTFAIEALARLTGGKVSIEDSTIALSGTARSVDDYEALRASLAAPLPKGFTLASDEIAPASVSPYGWRGEKGGETVTLSGYVPSPRQKEAVRAAATELFAGDRIVDRIRIAAGEPRVDWLGAIKFALGQLSQLDHGSVALGNGAFAIEGEAESSEAYIALLATNTGTLPAGLQDGNVDIRAPLASPYRLVIAREPDAVMLDGHVGSKEEREALLHAVQGKFGGLRVLDRLAYASGAPQDFLQAASAAAQAVSRLAGGYSEMSDATLNITGGAYYPAAAGGIVDTIAEEMPEGYDVAVEVVERQPAQPVSPLRCRDLLAGAMTTGRIEFAGGESEISADGNGLLDRVAAIVTRCPLATVEVRAHTDSDGSESGNMRLSQARADAIVEYLVDAGIARERLTATGRGESDPVADNSTDAGKAANRRIEFVLEEPEAVSDATEGTEEPNTEEEDAGSASAGEEGEE